MIKENELYSDNWESYQGGYWKREYDIKLHDGTIIENCYPNGGKFNSISDEHDQLDFDESFVSEIRFSQRPRYFLNDDVSEAKPDPEYLKRIEKGKYAQQQEPIHYVNPYKDLTQTRIISSQGKTSEEIQETRHNNIVESIKNHMKKNGTSWEQEIELVQNKQSKLSKRERNYLLSSL